MFLVFFLGLRLAAFPTVIELELFALTVRL
jgi:hypothetical protein